QSRVEDPYVECLQTKSRLTPWQQLRDVLDQLARQHDLGRERQLVSAVLVEERERVGVLAESLMGEVRGKQGNSLLLALRLRIRFQVFRLSGKADAERPLRKRSDLAEDVGVGRELELEVAGPAVIRTFFLERALGPSATATSARISPGSSIRPMPPSRSAWSPAVGPRMPTPSARRRSTLRCVAAFCHISTFIAGATMRGQRRARQSAESRSSPSPFATLARKSVVAGATTRMSRSRDNSMWPSLS